MIEIKIKEILRRNKYNGYMANALRTADASCPEALSLLGLKISSLEFEYSTSQKSLQSPVHKAPRFARVDEGLLSCAAFPLLFAKKL